MSWFSDPDAAILLAEGKHLLSDLNLGLQRVPGVGLGLEGKLLGTLQRRPLHVLSLTHALTGAGECTFRLDR